MYSEKPGKPDAPVIKTMTNTTATLTYTPPASDGGSEITNYVIEYRNEGGFKWQVANPNTMVDKLTYTVTSLHHGTIYEFRIAAENRAGVGPASDPTAPTEIKEPVSK